jgi:hypothetical protein
MRMRVSYSQSCVRQQKTDKAGAGVLGQCCLDRLQKSQLVTSCVGTTPLKLGLF